MTAPPKHEAVSEAPRSRWGRALGQGGESGENRREALGELAASYWYCVYAWWRRAGLDAARAETASLASFNRWLGEAPPGVLDSGSARMREWLPARLAELAREGVTLEGSAAIPIDPAWAERRYADEPPGEPDFIFQRRWALTVIEFTASTLQSEYAARGEETLFAELVPFAGFEPGGDERYSAAATRTGHTSGAMRKAVFDFRTRQRELLRAFVADTVLDPADADSELAALLCACDAPGSEAASAPLPTAIRALRPEEVFARAMRSVRMTQGAISGWQPPTVGEAAALFPRYEVISLIGRGGMGAVYKARQIELDRFIAIKLLPLEVSVDKDFAERFRREARAMAKLNHPNVIAVHDFGATSEGHLFFAMEFVEGADLHQMIHGPGLSPAQALEIIGGVCDALAYAHGKGIVHRDIKPANVMVSVEGQVKVADFGLARLTEPAAGPLGHTVTGVVMGTPDYMSPEQKRGINVDHRADIYSLGVMLYEMLCREVPQGIFDPPSARVPGVDARVDQVVTKAMHQQPDRRYQSTQEMKADVSAASARLSGLPAFRRRGAAGSLLKPGAGEEKRAVSGVAWAGVGIALLAAVAALVYFAPWKKGGSASGATSPAVSLAAAGQGGIVLPKAEKDAPFVNTLGQKYVPVPGTQALFCIWDTRVKDYAAYAHANKVDDAWASQQKEGVPVSREPEYPVVGVSWENANGFCQWLTEKESAEGKLPKGMKYRLPTDEEWSRAAGLGKEEGSTPRERSEKSGADLPPRAGDPPSKAVAGNYADTAFHEKFPKEKNWIEGYTDGYATTSPVGSFAPNEFGLYDMSGNVWQRCEDLFEPGSAERVHRGSSWADFGRNGRRLSQRAHAPPGSLYFNLGFRCVLAPASSPPPTVAAPVPAVSGAPATATREQPFVNTLGMKFVPVPILGGPTSGQRTLFSVWDTRVQDYEPFVDETKRRWPKAEFPQGPTHPAVMVSWEDAQGFCQWLTQREHAAGRLPAGFAYRLPSDHEWSCAVELGAREDAAKLPIEKASKIRDAFPWGAEWPPPKGAGNYLGEELRPAMAAGTYPNIKEVLAGYNDGFVNTSPVGSFAANRFGLFDIGGNVWQWCEDWYDKDHRDRVLRGAAWRDAGRGSITSSSRTHYTPVAGSSNYGFRCVLASAVPPSQSTGVLQPSPTFTPAPSATPKPPTEIEKWLAQVDAPQQEAFQKQVRKPFETGVADLRARYRAALDARIARASAANLLDEALAWRTEKQSFEKAQSVAPDDAGIPVAVKALRAGFRQQFAQLDQDRAARARILLAQYDAILAQNQTLLTQRARLDDALLLKNKRDEIARAWLGPAPFVTVGADGRPESAKPGSVLGATREQPFVNSLGMKFVPVPTGGQRVLFSVWDTRVKDYAMYAASRNVGDAWKKQDRNGVPVSREPDYPVAGVSWDDANAFCQWLTEKESAEGKLPKGMAYRLPTDEEWSRAVGLAKEEGATPKERDQNNQPDFPWGRGFPPPKAVGNYADSAWHEKFPNVPWLAGYTDGFATTSPVGSFPPNEYGLYDMGGNVWQWCQDLYEPGNPERVARGASWIHFRREIMLSSKRDPKNPDVRFNDNGFRCVLGYSAPAADGANSELSNPPGGGPSGGATVATARKDAPFVNGLGMKFVPVPGTGAIFCIWDTRVKDYAAYARVNKADDAWARQERDGVPVSVDPDCPVVGVSWENAKAFCQWLTKKESSEGTLPKGMVYRLPTDEEWSRAVGLAKEDGATPKERNEKNSVDFAWGTGFPPPKANVGNYADAAWHEKFPKEPWIQGYSDGYATTSPVGSFPANAFGLYDMGGNVWQWCEDWFDEDEKERVLRGGSWVDAYRAAMLCSQRHHNAPDGVYSRNGFRCVLAPTVSTSPAAAVPVSAVGGALDTAAKDAPFVNTLGMKFVPVPIRDGPTNGKRVLFSVWDTRVQDYEVFAGGTGREWPKPNFDQGPTHPVVMVTWEDSRLFCQWLTGREQAAGRLPAGFSYRLPSDYEWSCAVGLGAREDPTRLPSEKTDDISDAFPWDAQWPPPKGAGNYAGEELQPALSAGKYGFIHGVISGYRDDFENTSPVGSFAANRFGLFDMGGNVQQWCEDWFDEDRKARVLRGSSWINDARIRLLLSHRDLSAPGLRHNNLGFRCVLAASAR